MKPSYHGANGYRYYEEEQLLMLQQILFFRELGFNLNDIQKLLSQDDFDKVKALLSHKQILTDEINRKSNYNDSRKSCDRNSGIDFLFLIYSLQATLYCITLLLRENFTFLFFKGPAIVK